MGQTDCSEFSMSYTQPPPLSTNTPGEVYPPPGAHLVPRADPPAGAGPLAASLLWAVKRGEQDIVVRLLEAHNTGKLTPDTLSAQPDRDGTLLHWAVIRGLTPVCKVLLLLGAAVNSLTPWGNTPLHAAADNNQPHIVRLLLQHGADPNLKSESGCTPCHLAAYRGNTDVLRHLLAAGADISINNHQGACVSQHALLRTEGGGNRRVLRLLQAHTARKSCGSEASLQSVDVSTEQRSCRPAPVSSNQLDPITPIHLVPVTTQPHTAADPQIVPRSHDLCTPPSPPQALNPSPSRHRHTQSQFPTHSSGTDQVVPNFARLLDARHKQLIRQASLQPQSSHVTASPQCGCKLCGLGRSCDSLLLPTRDLCNMTSSYSQMTSPGSLLTSAKQSSQTNQDTSGSWKRWSDICGPSSSNLLSISCTSSSSLDSRLRYHANIVVSDTSSEEDNM